MRKLTPYLYPLVTTTLNGVMCWGINQLPDKVALGISSKLILGVTACSVLGIAFVSSQSSGYRTSSETTSSTWMFGLLPAIGSIILFFLIKYGHLPSELSHLAGYISLFLFVLGTLLPLIIVFWQVRQPRIVPHSREEPNLASDSGHSPPQSDPNLFPSARYRLAIILNTENFKLVGQAQLQFLVADLRNRSGDDSLVIVGMEKGSIILTLEGSEKGIVEIERLYNSGNLSDILEIRVKNLLRVDVHKKTPQEQAGISVDLYLQSQSQVEKILQEKLNIAPEEKLFGIQENLEILKHYLQDKEGSWFISITGEGGIGKTSIAEKLVREYTAISGFEKLAWITAKRVYLTLTGKTKDIERKNIGKTLNIDSMIFEIAK